MDLQQKTRSFGKILLLFALIARLSVPGTLQSIAAFVCREDHLAFLIYLETGQDVRSYFSPVETAPAEETTTKPTEVVSPPAAAAPTEAPTVPATAPTEALPLPDVSELSFYFAATVSPDLQALAEEAVALDTTGRSPAVLIYSTHSTESYTPGDEPYTPSGDYRTLEPDRNMLSLGKVLAQKLTDRGIGVLRDDSLHDSPSYNYAYSHARKTVTGLINENPTLRLVLDLHRDAAETKSGQLRTLTPNRTPATAQIMLVVGTNRTGLKHDHWERNLSMAIKLHRILEALCPGITRPLSIRSQRFNQDLSDGALLIEIGAAGNSRAEALEAVDILAQAIGELFDRYGSGC